MPKDPTIRDVFDLLTGHVETQKTVAEDLAKEQKTVRKLLVEIRDDVFAHAERLEKLEKANADVQTRRDRLEAVEQAIVKLVQRIP